MMIREYHTSKKSSKNFFFSKKFGRKKETKMRHRIEPVSTYASDCSSVKSSSGIGSFEPYSTCSTDGSVFLTASTKSSSSLNFCNNNRLSSTSTDSTAVQKSVITDIFEDEKFSIDSIKSNVSENVFSEEISLKVPKPVKPPIKPRSKPTRHLKPLPLPVPSLKTSLKPDMIDLFQNKLDLQMKIPERAPIRSIRKGGFRKFSNSCSN